MDLNRLMALVNIYTLVPLGGMSSSFLLLQAIAISSGKTTYELRHHVRVRCTAGIKENIAEVFGVLWGFNFLFPAHIVFRQNSDGIEWKHLKPA